MPLRLIEQLPEDLDAPRLAAYRNLVTASGGIMDQPDTGPTAGGDSEGYSLGWEWNTSIICTVRPPTADQLGSAAGPPVCATLEEIPGNAVNVFRCSPPWSLLVAADVRSWPGYVSCDGESGLATVSSVVRPRSTKMARWWLFGIGCGEAGSSL